MQHAACSIFLFFRFDVQHRTNTDEHCTIIAILTYAIRSSGKNRENSPLAQGTRTRAMTRAFACKYPWPEYLLESAKDFKALIKASGLAKQRRCHFRAVTGTTRP